MALAGDLDDQRADVSAGDPVEAWTLVIGSILNVDGGQTLQIVANDDSELNIWDAVVTRSGTSQRAITLNDSAYLALARSRIFGGHRVEWWHHAGHPGAELDLSDHCRVAPGERLSVGVDLAGSAAGFGVASPRATINVTTIYVEDAPVASRDVGNGVGVRIQFGQMDIVNGSRVDASNIGAVLWGEVNPDQRIRLNIDNSTLQSGRCAAIRVNAAADNTYDITVANGAQLIGGDGNLLLVGRDIGLVNTRTDVNFNVDDARLAGNITFEPTNAPTAKTANLSVAYKW
ncbi:hypothetical protein B9Y72_01425 [Stenotrophomonas maltophilia]|nr:hypothetical protein B9Y68_01425 [Stenotrophomonas maltophilia]PJL23006.1 hypothetical protein B9Y72_01425 [Stenotrophomonas maltophilia]